ncbi:MAG: hypothetical protein FWE01_03215 [Firmicutes bacterium]|nr:hypothetical protein [Bacillota bacterium]
MKTKAIYTKPKKASLELSKMEMQKKELVRSVLCDFEERKIKRKSQELQWRLNLDFYMGRQNNFITNFETLATAGKQFHWQRNESFNHIAAIIESRMSKLSHHKFDIEPVVFDTGDLGKITIELCKKIMESAFAKTKLDEVMSQALMWSEVTGSAFYKVFWDNDAGKTVGVLKSGETEQQITEGDVRISVCSPFEIFPDNLNAVDIGELQSIIHAKSISVHSVKEIWGVDLGYLGLEQVTVIEKYQMPNASHQRGRLVIIAHETLVYDGDLAYKNEKDDRYGLPFIRQASEQFVGSFFGKSVVERAIPVQRAYNIIKNRKVEFFNRMACGVLAIEEGSVDIDALENEGLCPGKIVVYRSGAAVPKFLDVGTLPVELEREEERLLREFETITGGEITRTGGSVSGVALAIMTEQDQMRLGRTLQGIERAKSDIACHVLRLYKQFATTKRLESIVEDGGKIEFFDFDATNISCDNVRIVSRVVSNGGMTSIN